MNAEARSQSLVVQALTPRHLDGAALVLAMQHAQHRATVPSLPEHLEAADAARQVIKGLIDADGAEGVVALRGASIVGYLIGAVLQTAPAAADAIYVPPRWARVSYGGAAVLPDDDAGEIHRAMYAALAPRWVAVGCLWHDMMLATVERDVLRAWFSLGFGLESLRGLRRTDKPIDVTGDRIMEVTFRQATPADVSTVAAFILGNATHHTGSPVFFPLVPEARALVQRHAAKDLEEAGTTYWLAEHDGRPVSMLSFSPAPAGGSLVAPSECVYLAEAYTVPEVRGRGVATALLRHCLRWARDSGFRWCAVNWDSANLEGSRFWLGHGFRPIGARVYRLLDERILWATAADR
jgi:GNAT superfamily N-acetyltransferase